MSREEPSACQYGFSRCRSSTILPGTHHSPRFFSMSAAGVGWGAGLGGRCVCVVVVDWAGVGRGNAGVCARVVAEVGWTSSQPLPQPQRVCLTQAHVCGAAPPTRTADVPGQVPVQQALSHGEAGVQVGAYGTVRQYTRGRFNARGSAPAPARCARRRRRLPGCCAGPALHTGGQPSLQALRLEASPPSSACPLPCTHAPECVVLRIHR